MIDMLAKILFLLAVVTAVLCNPIDQDEKDEDIPVYTEKVMQAKPTQAGRSVTRIPRFRSKKLSSLPKKAHSTDYTPSDDAGEPYPLPQHTTSAPKDILKTAKPIRSNPKPIRKIPDYPRNVIVDDDYPRRKPNLRGGYNAPRPSYAEAPQLGVEYAQEVPQNNYQPPPQRVVEEYRPRRPVLLSPHEYDSGAGNAPQLNYAQAPQVIPSPAKPDYGYDNNDYSEKPQPYIFGFELKDENGATQNRKEQGDDHGNKRGSYGYRDEHGIYRQVDYIADANGFRAVIKTNEPGTDNQNPADVEIHSEVAKY